MSHFSFFDTVKKAMKNLKDQKESNGNDTGGGAGGGEMEKGGDATDDPDTNLRCSAAAAGGITGRDSSMSARSISEDFGEEEVAGMTKSEQRKDHALAILMDSARLRFLRKGLVGSIVLEQLVGIATLQAACDVEEEDVEQYEADFKEQRRIKKQQAQRGGGGADEGDDQQRYSSAVSGESERLSGSSNKAKGRRKSAGSISGRLSYEQEDSDEENSYDPDDDDIDPLLLKQEKSLAGHAADALNAVEYIIKCLVSRSKGWDGRIYSDKVTLTRNVSVGFYLPVFMTVGFSITIELAATVKSLSRYRQRQKEIGMYRKALTFIDVSIVEEVKRQGFGERLAIKAVLATNSESAEAALHWAISNAEA